MVQGETLWAPQAAADRLFLFQEASKCWVCRSLLHYVVLCKLCRKICENSSRCSVSSMYRPVRPRLVDLKHSILSFNSHHEWGFTKSKSLLRIRKENNTATPKGDQLKVLLGEVWKKEGLRPERYRINMARKVSFHSLLLNDWIEARACCKQMRNRARKCGSAGRRASCCGASRSHASPQTAV